MKGSCDTREKPGKSTGSIRECILQVQPCKRSTFPIIWNAEQEGINGVWSKLDQLSITASSNWATSTTSLQSSKAAKIRANFDTPEARHSFCLSAFRPSLDTEEDSEHGSEGSDASSLGIEDEQHALSISPKLGFQRGYCLQRTDKPVTDFSLPPNAPSHQGKASSGQNAASRKAPQTNMNRSSSLRAEELWSDVRPRKVLNPFEGHSNDAGFFGCLPLEMLERNLE